MFKRQLLVCVATDNLTDEVNGTDVLYVMGLSVCCIGAPLSLHSVSNNK